MHEQSSIHPPLFASKAFHFALPTRSRSGHPATNPLKVLFSRHARFGPHIELGRPPTRYQLPGPFSSAPHRTDSITFAVASSPVMHVESFYRGCPACIFL